MINGAIQILNEVSGEYIDPFLLAECQANKSSGFVAITYDAEQIGCDLLFLEGKHIIKCARMNPDLRFLAEPPELREMFAANKQSSRIYLYSVQSDLMHRFISTFSSDTCLNVHVEELSKKQIALLVKATGCRRGILERNIFGQNLPMVELQEVDATQGLPNFQMGFKQGRLIFYDIAEEKVGRALPGGLINSHLSQESSTCDCAILASSPQINLNVRLGRDQRSIPGSDTNSQRVTSAVQAPQHKDEDEIEAFVQLLDQIQSQRLLTEQNASAGTARSLAEVTATKSTRRSPRSTRRVTVPDQSNSNKVLAEITEEAVEPQGIQLPIQVSLPAEPTPGRNGADYIRLFERLLRSFRKQAFECFGAKYETAVREAEGKVRFLTPEFHLSGLNTETVTSVLELMEEIIKEAPLLKRSRLRTAALTLVSDLYNKNYEILERHQAIDKVEQFYYRLKK